MDQDVKINDLSAIEAYSSMYSRMGDEYIFARLKMTPEVVKDESRAGVRLNGLTMLLTMRGSMTLEFNTETYKVGSPSLVVSGSNTLMRVVEADYERLDTMMLFLSPDFITGINIDLNVLQKSHLAHRRSPVLPLDDKKAKLLMQYMEMLHINAEANPGCDIYARNISRSLIAALVYQLMQIADKQYYVTAQIETSDDNHRPGVRRMTYVKEFMELVHANYTRERSVGFYSEKLCISSKYLSHIVKDATGRSAAEWIDEYVILEAKNMLRFSGMNVQQVAYALNFTNQSAFGKYFKHLTGMSPTRFQKN